MPSAKNWDETILSRHCLIYDHVSARNFLMQASTIVWNAVSYSNVVKSSGVCKTSASVHYCSNVNIILQFDKHCVYGYEKHECGI